jgi:hypothetical protein
MAKVKNKMKNLKDVGPTFEDIVSFAMTEEGNIDLSIIQLFEGRYTHIHGDCCCDVLVGPCACGKIH